MSRNVSKNPGMSWKCFFALGLRPGPEKNMANSSSPPNCINTNGLSCTERKRGTFNSAPNLESCQRSQRPEVSQAHYHPALRSRLPAHQALRQNDSRYSFIQLSKSKLQQRPLRTQLHYNTCNILLSSVINSVHLLCCNTFRVFSRTNSTVFNPVHKTQGPSASPLPCRSIGMTILGEWLFLCQLQKRLA